MHVIKIFLPPRKPVTHQGDLGTPGEILSGNEGVGMKLYEPL